MATFSSSGNITSWVASSNHFPQDINGQSCVAYSGHIYCVGGTYDSTGDDVASSYFATLTDSGAIGPWMPTTSFPIPIDTESCVASSFHIYCIGGNNETDGTNADATLSNSVWFATISSSGIGNWSQTTSYPTNDYFPDCLTAGGYAYCIGGEDSNGNSLTTSYFAPLTANGVGPWTQTIAYPVAATGQACAISAGAIYCVGGETAGGPSPTYTNAVYYAQISSGGIGGWKQSSSYPRSVGTTCAISSAYLYCVGGFDSGTVDENGAVNYASLTSLAG
jgi:N-acetylneuraminic acid mutarotase